MSVPPGVPPGARPKLQPQGYTYWLVGDERAILRDAYHTFLQSPWPLSLGVIALGFLSINLVFAAIYYGIGGVDGVRTGSFYDVYVFSVQTLGTIGYGVMTPKSNGANAVMIAESIASVIFVAIATGLVFAKFSRPTARVAFTRHLVVAQHDGVPTLMFRLGNRRSNIIVEAHLRVMLSKLQITKEGRTFYRMYDLKLVRDRMSGMRRGWTAMHVVDETSPIYGLDAQGLAKAEVELEVSLVGYDNITMQTVHSIHQYTDKDIKLGHRFVDTMTVLPGGDIVFDLGQFDAVVPDDGAHDSVAA